MGLRLSEEDEILGADYVEHCIGQPITEVSEFDRMQEGRRSAFGFVRRPYSNQSNRSGHKSPLAVHPMKQPAKSPDLSIDMAYTL